MRATVAIPILAGAAIGLGAIFVSWTGDGRGIDYILPGSRFESGHQLPLPLTILAIGAVLGVSITFINGMGYLLKPWWERSAFYLLGWVGGLMMVLCPLLAHSGYWIWLYWNDYGGGVFQSRDWGIGLWLALAGSSLALAALPLSTIKRNL